MSDLAGHIRELDSEGSTVMTFPAAIVQTNEELEASLVAQYDQAGWVVEMDVNEDEERIWIDVRGVRKP